MLKNLILRFRIANARAEMAEAQRTLDANPTLRNLAAFARANRRVLDLTDF